MSNTIKSYFRNKKADVSDKSNNGDERKKKRGRLDLSLNQDDADVFSEGIFSSRCASILYNCQQNSTKYTCSQPQRKMPRLKALNS